MTTVEINLPDTLKEFVEHQVAAGGYRDASAYVQSLLEEAQLSQRRTEIDEELLERIKAVDRAVLEAKLLEGVDALERGEGRVMTEQDWERLHDKLEERIRSRSDS